MSPPIEDLRNSTMQNTTIERGEVNFTPEQMKIGQLIVFTTVVFLFIVVVYVFVAVCRRTFTAHQVKNFASNFGSSTPLRHFIHNPGAVHVVDSRSELEWDMDDLDLDLTRHTRYVQSCANPT